MDNCSNHPTHVAIEHCELCALPLCGLCLWYSEGGHRLCETHAREREEGGEKVQPPHTYHEAIHTSLAAQPLNENGVYRGNSNDLMALVAALAGVVTLLSCMGGAYCLPPAALILGGVAFFGADRAVDPRRTRLLAGIGAATAGSLLLLILSFFACYLLFIFMAIVSSGSGP